MNVITGAPLERRARGICTRFPPLIRPCLGCRAGPSRCGAQCKTWARGSSEQWFYDVIVFRQPCYDRGRAQICSAALTRELSTFANVREEIF